MDNNNIQLQHYEHDSYGMNKWPSSQHYIDQQQQKHIVKQSAPSLLSLNPNHGQEGTMLTMVLQDLPAQSVKLAFNSLVVDTKQLRSQQHDGGLITTTLMATVPSFQLTLSATNTVPISVCFLNNDDIIEDTILVTNFAYQFDSQHQYQYERKRSFASLTDDDYSSSSPNKRGYQDMHYQSTYDLPVTPSGYGQADVSSPYSSYFQQQHHDGQHAIPLPVQQQPQHTLPMIMESPMQVQQQEAYYLPPTTTSPIPPTSSPFQRRKSYQRPSVQSLKSTSHHPSTTVANYQPYPGLVSQSNFELVDDLDKMMHHWTVAEQQAGRRLVRFWREDKAQDLIQCGCEPLAQNDAAASDTNNTVVSCIYWPEQDDYYITSVDCIYLLESLMKTHFGVEEKNRIRRNLEGFRPMTVAKNKPISAEFFKRVMGFPHPKPRNIEKDIKAFTWKILPFALKKIITKYSVASTTSDAAATSGLYASSLLPPSSSPVSHQQQQHYTNHTMPPPPPPSLSSSSIVPSSSTNSTASSTDSLATSMSSLPTPPSAHVEDDLLVQHPPYPHHQQQYHHHHHHHQHQSKQALHYNPTTMSYGHQQEPGYYPTARSGNIVTPSTGAPPTSSSSTTSSSSSPAASPSQLYHTEASAMSMAPAPSISPATTPQQQHPYPMYSSITEPYQVPHPSSTASPSSNFVSQLLMDHGSPYEQSMAGHSS